MPSMPRDIWLKNYKLEARKIQSVIDDLRESIVNARDAALCSRWVCGKKPAGATEDHPAFTSEEVSRHLANIRRFQILTRDCGDLQRSASVLASSPKDMEFSHYSPWEINPKLDTPKKLPPEVGDRLKANS